MRLSYICAACKTQNFINEKADTRVGLQMKLNRDEIQVNCKKCGKRDKKHINRVDAVVDNRLVLIGIVLGGIATVFLWELGWIASATFLIPVLFWRHEMGLKSTFNKTLISRK